MKRLSIFLAASILAGPGFADAITDVRNAEIAFAKAFADRNQTEFFNLVTDDATFLGGRTLKGKKEVVERWSRFFADAVAPFSWAPERVAVNAAGNIALSTGPVFGADGKQIGNYTSTWVRQQNGAWKILFDGGGGPPVCLAESAAATEQGFVTADDGAKLHFRKIGSGPTTLIVPLGFAMYDDFKSLADVATIITYDPRNRGRSERVENVASLTIANDVKDIEAVRRHFNVDKFVPVGYSYLGLMVAMYAIEHPERVERIVQLGPVPRKFTTEYPKEVTHGREDVGAPAADYKRWQEMRASGAAQQSPREFCEAEWRVIRYVLVGNAKNASRVTIPCDLPNEWPSNFQRHLEHHFESVQKVDVPASALAKITMPVLTIHGTFDRNAPYGAGREWAASLPNARLVTVTGAAHQSWSDDPATVFAAIREFIRGNWPLSAEGITR